MEPLVIRLKPFSGKISEKCAISQRFDPYLVIRYGAASFYTNVSKNTGKFPYWNDFFTFKKINDEQIWVECWDYNVDFDADKEVFLGKGEIDLSKCLLDKKSLVWVSIERKKSTDSEEIEKTCELLIEIEVSLVKKNEEAENNEEQTENDVVIINENDGNNDNYETNHENIEVLQEYEPNFVTQTNKITPLVINNNNIVMKPQQVPTHVSQRSFTNPVLPNKIMPNMIASPLQNYGRIINYHPQNTNMMYYHQPQIHYS